MQAHEKGHTGYRVFAVFAFVVIVVFYIGLWVFYNTHGCASTHPLPITTAQCRVPALHLLLTSTKPTQLFMCALYLLMVTTGSPSHGTRYGRGERRQVFGSG